MIWGCVSAKGVGEMNVCGYTKTLADNMTPHQYSSMRTIQSTLPKSPKMISKEKNSEHMTCPNMSPDLNPLEYL